MSVTAAEILREGMHLCPAHPDRRASLSVRRAPDGRWLLHDFGGCSTEAILAAAGLTFADLFPGDSSRPPTRPARRLHWRDEIERSLIARAKRAAAKLEPYLDMFEIGDFIRERRRAIAEARRHASACGEVDGTWAVLAAVAAEERAVNTIENEVDVAMGAMRWR